MTASQRPWYLVSISFRFWWSLFPCLSLIEPRFSGNLSMCENRWCILTLMLQPRFLKAVSMLLASSAYFLALLLPRKFFTTRTNAFHASSSSSFIKFSNSGSLMSCQMRCQLSTSPRSILEKPGTSKWSSDHPCPEPWWTAWLSRAWCTAVERVFCLCPLEGRWWRSFLCKAPIPPANASPSSCNTENQFLEDFEVLRL